MDEKDFIVNKIYRIHKVCRTTLWRRTEFWNNGEGGIYIDVIDERGMIRSFHISNFWDSFNTITETRKLKLEKICSR